MTGVKMPKLHPVTWAHDLVDPALCSLKDAATILCGMWSLWMTRNKRRHGEAVYPVQVTVQWVKDMAFDLWQIAHPPKIQRLTPTVCQQWRKPDPGWIKCNVEASFHDGDRTGATGVVLRDHDGRACGASARWYEHSLNALATEAMACRDGMQFARGRGVRKLLMETDCQVLVNLWENSAMQRSEIDRFMQEMAELSRSFEFFSLCFVTRKCNRLAHECAKLVSRGNPVDEWLLAPPGLRVIIDDDCDLAHG